MSGRRLGTVALVLALSSAPSAGGQAPAPLGIPECDRYAEMVRSCLPRMCGEERAMRELELGLALETVAAVAKLKGREAAAQSCAQDIAREVDADEYACYPESPSSRESLVQKLQIRPGSTKVSMSFAGASPAAPQSVEVAIAASLLEEPDAVYRLEADGGAFALDTAVDVPSRAAAGASPGAPVPLEPGMTYCYAIGSADGALLGTVYRKGTFTTTSQRRP